MGTSRLQAIIITAGVAAFCIAGAAARTARLAREEASRAELDRVVPETSGELGFVSSDACRSCHPEEHASWHATFHRTMTQVAGPETVIGDFNDVRIDYHGRMFHLERRGDEFWASAGGEERRIVMTTGLHHYQVYWTRAAGGGWLESFPFVYLREDGRWVPRHDVFLLPPELNRQPEKPRVWNLTCIQCHSTHGRPRFDQRTLAVGTRVGELGIGCEACHGPAAGHVSAHRNPGRRYRQRLAGGPDSTIVNPKRLDPRAASEVCGQCHSVFDKEDREDWRVNGFDYRAGGELEASKFIARHPARAEDPGMADQLAKRRIEPDTYFWADGMIRVSGREYNGLIETPCYRRGDLSCLSCHSMHRSDPDDQLAAGMDGDEACLQCHGDFRRDPERHTRHPAASSGSRCMNCHMPHTTYGLLKAIRSHEIDSPGAAVSVRPGRPNACNLCHLDRTLDWTARRLEEWYGIPPPPIGEDDRAIAASVLWLLRGDAGQRAIAAWHLGWEPALEASGRDWQAPILSHLLDDPYSAVRYLVQRSLGRLPGYGGFSYDYIAPAEELSRARERAIAAWPGLEAGAAERAATALLIGLDGRLDAGAVRRLLSARDDRPVDLLE